MASKMPSAALVLLSLSLMASSASAFLSPLTVPASSRARAVMGLRMGQGEGVEGASRSSRRVVMEGAFALGAGAVLRPLSAFAADDDDDDFDEAPRAETQQREVTFKTNDAVCEKHPTWKQCRKAAKSSGGSTKAPLQEMENGLKYKELTVGKGNSPRPGDTVTVHFSLFYKGDEIESSRESSGLAAAPLGFQYGVTKGAGSVLPAINDGITDMKVGGIRRVIAPPELAFGSKGKKPRIPPDATVEFDLQLLTVKRAGTNPISSQGRGAEKNTGLFDLF
uniref:peptidylprolyl isomerase n=2 Tax=Hemiselmis andersenii TaxID=464988 RepID=A0A7S0TW73_HEMAN